MTPLAFVEKQPPPPYLLFGDETQLLEEMRAAVRRRFGRDDVERAYLEELPGSPLLQERGKGLFGGASAQTLVEVTGFAPPAKEEQEALAALLNKKGDDVVLVVLHNLEYRHTKTAWFEKLCNNASAVKANRLSAAEATRWLRRWAAELDLPLDEEATALLAAQTEGNLVPAKQAVIKMSLAEQAGNVAAARSALADGAKYDLFDLSGGVLGGLGSRAITILRQLRAAGVADPLLLWGVSNIVLQAVAAGEGKTPRLRREHLDGLRAIARRAPPPVMRELLQYAAYADRVCKGVAPGDAETALAQIAIRLAALARNVKITLPAYLP